MAKFAAELENILFRSDVCQAWELYRSDHGDQIRFIGLFAEHSENVERKTLLTQIFGDRNAVQKVHLTSSARNPNVGFVGFSSL